MKSRERAASMKTAGRRPVRCLQARASGEDQRPPHAAREPAQAPRLVQLTLQRLRHCDRPDHYSSSGLRFEPSWGAAQRALHPPNAPSALMTTPSRNLRHPRDAPEPVPPQALWSIRAKRSSTDPAQQSAEQAEGWGPNRLRANVQRGSGQARVGSRVRRRPRPRRPDH